jgi:outer membrane protein assembly factor BamB
VDENNSFYRTGKLSGITKLAKVKALQEFWPRRDIFSSSAGNAGNLLALDPATGKALWHLNAGGEMVASPVAYELEGRQCLLIPVLYAFSLPEKTASRATE